MYRMFAANSSCCLSVWSVKTRPALLSMFRSRFLACTGINSKVRDKWCKSRLHSTHFEASVVGPRTSQRRCQGLSRTSSHTGPDLKRCAAAATVHETDHQTTCSHVLGYKPITRWPNSCGIEGESEVGQWERHTLGGGGGPLVRREGSRCDHMMRQARPLMLE